MFISTTDELEQFCAQVRERKVMGIDTEFMRERTYHPMLCLIQVSYADVVAAIDPTDDLDLTPLVEVLEDGRITKVMHGCDQDLEVLYDSLGAQVSATFDTQLAAAFLGHRMQMGLGSVVEHYCGVHLDKADGLTDWSRRPLDAEQLRYALDDVRYLPSIYETMMAELVQKDRLGWFMPEMEKISDPGRFKRDARLAYLRLKRAGSLTRKQLAVAREICAWREDLAERRDQPRKWVLSDEVVVEISRRAPSRVDRLRRIRGTESIPDREARRLILAIEAGTRCPPQDYPKIRHRARPSAQTDSVADLMYALVRLLSERCGVAIPLIATRDDLYDFMAQETSCPLREGWRYEVAGRHLEGLLKGEVGLVVRDGRIEML